MCKYVCVYSIHKNIYNSVWIGYSFWVFGKLLDPFPLIKHVNRERENNNVREKFWVVEASNTWN